MTENSFSNVLLNSADGQSRLQADQKKSPWDKFLNTLDANPKMTDREVMDMFAKTLSTSTSDWKDSNDNTLLMHMASRGKTGVVKRLIHELYANPNATNKEGATALHMAARGGFRDVCTELMDSHADPCKKDKNGSTPAMIAEDNGHGDIAKMLGDAEISKRLFMSFDRNRTRPDR